MSDAQPIARAYQELRTYSDSSFFTSPEARDQYLNLHASRFADTLESLRPAVSPGAKMLEIGIRPYLLSVLVRNDLRLSVDGVNDGPTEDFAGIHTFGLNIEQAKVPRPDGYYDLVMICEVLEHLLDPAPALAEANRLLRPGGHLFVSTPNAIAIGKALTLLMGRNIYSGYSATSPYGRHNREYTAAELSQVLPAFGFEVVRLWNRNYRDLRGRPTPLFYYLTALFPSRRQRLDVLSRKVGPVLDAHPTIIYRSPHVEYREG